MRTPLQIVADHYAASDRHDLEAMLADLADDANWTEMAGSQCAGTYVGRDQVVDNVFKVLGGEWEGYAFHLERLVDGGDTIVAIGNYSGVYRATGKTMRARVAHVWQVEGGKLRRFEQFADTLLMALAMK